MEMTEVELKVIKAAIWTHVITDWVESHFLNDFVYEQEI